MSDKWRGLRNWTLSAIVIGLLTAGGLALAQEDTAIDQDIEEAAGPPWLRPEFADNDWRPGTPGPPPWAGQDDNDDNGQGPPWTREGYDSDWRPGSGGPPPWAGQDDDDDNGQGPPWTREGYDSDWRPGSGGPPPWAGQDDD